MKRLDKPNRKCNDIMRSVKGNKFTHVDKMKAYNVNQDTEAHSRTLPYY